MNTAVDVTVTGQVQGVSFRWYAVREATRLGVTGWVRNEPDGSVAGHFEGDPTAVARGPVRRGCSGWRAATAR
jgi:acylphosphatase